MKKQTPKKQTSAKRHVAKPRQAKTTGKPKTKSKVEPKAKPKKAKPVVVAPPPKAKMKKSKPAVKPPAPPVAEPVVQSRPVTTLPAPVIKPDQSEMESLRRIEIVLAEAESAISETAVQTSTNPVSAGLLTELTELLEELIDTANPKLASTVSRLAYVLSEVMPGLSAVSKRADIALCRKCGVTFGWDRRAEAERAVRSGKYQKSITVS